MDIIEFQAVDRRAPEIDMRCEFPPRRSRVFTAVALVARANHERGDVRRGQLQLTPERLWIALKRGHHPQRTRNLGAVEREATVLDPDVGEGQIVEAGAR